MTQQTSRSDSLVVRRATVDDWPRIWKFIQKAYEDLAQYKDEDRWNWQFVNNPFTVAKKSDTPDSVWVAVENNCVVGQIAVQKAQLNLSGNSLSAGWIVDVMVLPSHRGKQLGHRIHAECASKESLLVTLTMAPATRRIAEKAGCITLHRVFQYSRWQRLGADGVRLYLLNRTLHRPKLHRWALISTQLFGAHILLPILLNPILALRDWLQCRFRRTNSHITIEEKGAFDEEFDHIWNEHKGEYQAIFSRSSQFLEWRFEQCPALKYQKFIARRDGSPTGYIVLRRAQEGELPQGFIVDLFASRNDEETLDSLVRFSLEHFGDSVAEVNCATSIAEFSDALRRVGFFVTRTMRPTCVCSDSGILDKLERAEWFFSKADHDWDQIHLANHSSNT